MATQVGEAVVKLTFDGSDVTASLEKASSQMEKTASSSGKGWGSAWSVAAGSLISKGVSKIANAIGSNLNSAISRVDTISNFPKVMQAVGYSAEESTSSINKITESLDGLPTSADEAISNIQKLAATMGNLNTGTVNATTVGLALNDMLLAGGKGTAAATNALEQYNQMLAVGKVDQMAWNSLVNAAPGQMDQLSKTLIGATAGQGDLYKAMKDGTVSFEEFNAAIVDLDKNGGAGFESFYNQAVSATEGLGTQIQNLSTSFVKILSAPFLGNDITAAVNQFSSRLETLLKQMVPGLLTAVGAIITQLIPALPPMIANLIPTIASGITNIINSIAQSLPAFLQGVMSIIIAIANALVENLPTILQAVVSMILSIITVLTSPDNLNAILQAAVLLFFGIIQAIPQIIEQLLVALPDILTNIIEFLTDPRSILWLTKAAVKLFYSLVLAVPQILGALVQAFRNLVQKLWQKVENFFTNFAAQFGTKIGDAFKRAINGVLSMIEGFLNSPIKILNRFIGAINNAFGAVGINLGTIALVRLPRLAQGGYASGSSLVNIGEAGKEVVLPLENNTDNWAGLLASELEQAMTTDTRTSGGRQIVVNMTNEINNEMDAADIGRLLMQSIRRSA